jgi:hypothetical protein
MRFTLPLLFVVALFALQANLPAQDVKPSEKKEAEAPPDTSGDERILREAKVPVDPAALLEYFRKRTYPEVNPEKLTQLVVQLGDKAFKVREKAFDELLTLGASALAVVRQAVRESKDYEVQHRATELSQRIEDSANPSVQGASARLIAVRKPAGAADVLLNYLPFAADDTVIDELCKALTAVAVRDGKVEPSVVKALTDKVAVKRGAAGVALVASGAAEHLPAARKLLDDATPAVRLRVALSLIQRKEKDAIPRLIDGLAHLNPQQLWQAEELLIRLAADKAPPVSLGIDDASRQKCHAAWLAWWKENEKNIDLAKVDLSNTMLGYTLYVHRTLSKIVNGKRLPAGFQVVELDHNKKERWKIEIPTFPVDAQVLSQDRVLICEYTGNRITERDFKGNVKWEKQIVGGGNPISAQRLANGNTFVVMPNRLLEIDRDGKQVYSMQRQQFDMFRGRKLRNGEIVYITNQGRVTYLDPKTNKELRSFQIGNIGMQFGNFEVLNNGNLLIPVYQTHQVVEYDPTGKVVWQVQSQFPNAVQRLPNGNTLISSFNTRRIIEVNRNGQEVWSFTAEGQIYTARRR